MDCFETRTDKSLADILFEKYKEVIEDDRLTPNNFTGLLREKENKTILILDGVDEMGEAHYAFSLNKKLKAFLSRHRNIKVLIAGRNRDSLDILTENFSFGRYKIELFSETNIGEYSSRLFGPEKKEAFLEKLKDINPDVKGTPFMLKWLAKFYADNSALPGTETEILEKAVAMLISEIDLNRHYEIADKYSEKEKIG